MEVIDYRSLAEEWLEHVAEQYEITHLCRKDLLLVEHLLKKGFTLVALRDEENILQIDFLVKPKCHRVHAKRGV